MGENVKLTITRPEYYRDRLRSYKIIVDGTEIGSIKAGETFSSSIAPGSHRVFLKIDWCRSNILDFATGQSSEVQLVCGSSIGGWRILLALIYVTFLWDKYLWIRKLA